MRQCSNANTHTHKMCSILLQRFNKLLFSFDAELYVLQKRCTKLSSGMKPKKFVLILCNVEINFLVAKFEVGICLENVRC